MMCDRIDPYVVPLTFETNGVMDKMKRTFVSTMVSFVVSLGLIGGGAAIVSASAGATTPVGSCQSNVSATSYNGSSHVTGTGRYSGCAGVSATVALFLEWASPSYVGPAGHSTGGAVNVRSDWYNVPAGSYRVEISIWEHALNGFNPLLAPGCQWTDSSNPHYNVQCSNETSPFRAG